MSNLSHYKKRVSGDGYVVVRAARFLLSSGLRLQQGCPWFSLEFSRVSTYTILSSSSILKIEHGIRAVRSRDSFSGSWRVELLFSPPFSSRNNCRYQSRATVFAAEGSRDSFKFLFFCIAANSNAFYGCMMNSLVVICCFYVTYDSLRSRLLQEVFLCGKTGCIFTFVEDLAPD